MTRTGKIARLTEEIRTELNQRLLDGQKASAILPWLNALPEVRSILQAEFAGRPVNAVNLSEWKNGGHLDWLVRQHALELVRNLDDKHGLGDESLTIHFNAKLSRWIALQLAATAQIFIAGEKDQQARWSRLREFASAIYRLRRGDFESDRISLQSERLVLDQSNNAQQREKEFWAWTERPEIREKLFPDRDKGLSEETLEKIERELRLM